MTTMRIPAENVFTRVLFKTIGNDDSHIPYFLKKVFDNLLMEAIGKSQFIFCNIMILGDGESCYITYLTKELSTMQECVKINDILDSFKGKLIEVSTSVIDKDHE